MRYAALVWLVLGAIAWQAWGQRAKDPNEGSRLTLDQPIGAYKFSWWGRAGKRYFIQQSDDLYTWNYLPVIETGTDEVIQWGFTSSSDRFFLRLQIVDDPYNTDSDGDGVSDANEVLSGGTGDGSMRTDPRLKDAPSVLGTVIGFATP